MSYYDDPFTAGEVDWSKKDDEGYWEMKKQKEEEKMSENGMGKKRIIIEMDVDYWTPESRKGLMQFLIHNFKVTHYENPDDEFSEEVSDFKGRIIEPASPYPSIPVQEPDDKIFKIEW